MKQNKILLAMLVALSILSFKDKNASVIVKTGIYGVCSCGESSARKLELTINDDKTFHYFNNEDPARIVDVKGNWELNGTTVFLKNYNSDISISNKWNIDKNEKCLKSRKGIEWTRLCHIQSCK